MAIVPFRGERGRKQRLAPLPERATIKTIIVIIDIDNDGDYRFFMVSAFGQIR